MQLREAHIIMLRFFPLPLIPTSSFYWYHFYKTINKKATINPKNNNDKCFQYAILSIKLSKNKKNPKGI